MTTSRPVTIVGAGMAGAACAAALADAGVTVRVLDRSRAPGGRMASPELRGRRVDIGAGYFTVRDDGFDEVVRRWQDCGLAREWTDTFGVVGGDGADGGDATSTGPMRWSTPGGLRRLVRDVLGDIDVTTLDVEDLPDGDVVLAMPDPQAARITGVPDAVGYEPVIAVVVEFDAIAVCFADLPFAGAAFVNDHPDVAFVADDGSRRGDRAPVLVVHTTPQRARRHLDDPAAAVPVVVDAITTMFGLDRPIWTHPHRWRFAKPAGSHETSHHLTTVDGRLIGLAGDQWCPQGSPRVESAWRSGTDLAASIIASR